MTTRSSNHKPGKDDAAPPATEPAATPASAATPPPGGKNPAAVQLGRLGGKKGGPARARKLTKEQRAAIARKAAQARWANHRRP